MVLQIRPIYSKPDQAHLFRNRIRPIYSETGSGPFIPKPDPAHLFQNRIRQALNNKPDPFVLGLESEYEPRMDATFRKL